MLKIENHMVVLFGATGDLAKRKLFPALYSLFKKGLLHKNVPFVCIGREKYSKKEYLDFLSLDFVLGVGDRKNLLQFKKQIEYFALDFSCPACSGFKQFIDLIDKKYLCHGNKLFYMATPPAIFSSISFLLKEAKILKGNGWNRAVFEKPFGYDLKSAKKLNKELSSVFSEKETYRIDHYLGKELVQDIIVARFSNAIFEQIWNKDFVENVQITVAESIGVGDRGGYYEHSGVIRDMIQNHIMQLIALTAMNKPKSMNSKDILNEKMKVLSSLEPAKTEDVVIGQYGAGIVDKKKVNSYLQEINVLKNSTTPTFAAIKLTLNLPRWNGVPFYVRTGKYLKKGYAEIRLVLKDVSCAFFSSKMAKNRTQNMIILRIQPQTGIAIDFNVNNPETGSDILPVKMDFCYDCTFKMGTKDAYEVLFRAVMNGDKTLFTRWDGISESWKYVDKVISLIQKRTPLLYRPASFGPVASDTLLKKNGFHWINP